VGQVKLSRFLSGSDGLRQAMTGNMVGHFVGCLTPDSAGTDQICVVLSLQPSTKYYFGLKTVDEAGNWSVLSNVVSAETDDLVPPGGVTDLEVR
jgi:hypothetical protein